MGNTHAKSAAAAEPVIPDEEYDALDEFMRLRDDLAPDESRPGVILAHKIETHVYANRDAIGYGAPLPELPQWLLRPGDAHLKFTNFVGMCWTHGVFPDDFNEYLRLATSIATRDP
jgi:hypothetical protein